MSTAATVHKMGVMQLTLLTVVNMMGSGIILLPTKLAEVGTLSITSWIVTALGSLALAYAFAKCGRFNRQCCHRTDGDGLHAGLLRLDAVARSGVTG